MVGRIGCIRDSAVPVSAFDIAMNRAAGHTLAGNVSDGEAEMVVADLHRVVEIAADRPGRLQQRVEVDPRIEALQPLRGGTMPSWMARAAWSSPSVSAVAIRSWTSASRSRSRSIRASANSAIATPRRRRRRPATAGPDRTAGTQKGEGEPAADRNGHEDDREGNAVGPSEYGVAQRKGREQRASAHSMAPANPGRSSHPPRSMASTACAWTKGPNSSAASGVAAMSDVPSA